MADKRATSNFVENFGARGFHSCALASSEDDCEIQLAQLPTFLASGALFYLKTYLALFL
jgi:hypothetical protein